jgi:hypothetical protein
MTAVCRVGSEVQSIRKGSRRPDITVERPDGTVYGVDVGKQSRRNRGADQARGGAVTTIWKSSGTLEMQFVAHNT